MPTSAAARDTSPSTASATAAPPAACSSARGVEVGRAPEVVLAPHELGRCLGHRPAGAGIACEQLERGVQRLCLGRVDRNLQGDVVGQLREPADIAHHDRLSERELPDHAAGCLAHRRRAQADAHVAGGHQRPQPVLLHIRLPDDALVGQAEPLQAAVEVEAGRDRADEQEPSLRATAAQPRERLQQLRDALARVHVPERADQRTSHDPGRSDGRDAPGGMRDPPDRPLVARRACPLSRRSASERSDRWPGRAPPRPGGTPRAGSPRAAGVACRGRHGRADVRRRRPRAPSRRGSRGRRGGRSSAPRRDGAGRSRAARRRRVDRWGGGGARRRSSRAHPGCCRRGRAPRSVPRAGRLRPRGTTWTSIRSPSAGSRCAL